MRTSACAKRPSRASLLEPLVSSLPLSEDVEETWHRPELSPYLAHVIIVQFKPKQMSGRGPWYQTAEERTRVAMIEYLFVVQQPSQGGNELSQ
ncbi:hypothetical protein EYF80_017117 [Liparis tanakae]|uniref:Uncharacterized protein n=1 Tax=Liparis tanakae TaxID=230148 RepID=A0A4Z2I3Z5_9TELE|nr:hypothetical protein EYF80_017117 [Liparis tanakae]